MTLRAVVCSAPNARQSMPFLDLSTPDARSISPSVRAGVPRCAHRSHEIGIAKLPSSRHTTICRFPTE